MVTSADPLSKSPPGSALPTQATVRRTVDKANRLARDLVVSETLLAEFRKLGVKVVAAEGGTDLTVDNDDPSRKMIRQILGVVSEWEKSCIVQKLRAARIL